MAPSWELFGRLGAVCRRAAVWAQLQLFVWLGPDLPFFGKHGLRAANLRQFFDPVLRGFSLPACRHPGLKVHRYLCEKCPFLLFQANCLFLVFQSVSRFSLFFAQAASTMHVAWEARWLTKIVFWWHFLSVTSFAPWKTFSNVLAWNAICRIYGCWLPARCLREDMRCLDVVNETLGQIPNKLNMLIFI